MKTSRLLLVALLAVGCGSSGHPALKRPEVNAGSPIPADRTEAAGARASSLADQLLADGRWDEAIVQFRRAHSIAMERLPGSLTEGITAAKLASALMDGKAYDEAIPIFEDATRTLNSVLPHDDPNLALLAGQEVKCLRAASRNDEAYRVLRALFARSREEHIELPADILAMAHDDANVLVDQGEYVGGAMLYEDVIASLDALGDRVPPHHRFLAISSLASLYEKADLPDQELATLRRLTELGFVSDDEHCDTWSRVTSAALRAGRADEAQGYLDQAWGCWRSSDADTLAWFSFQFSRLGRTGAAHRVVDRALSEKKLDAKAKAKLLHVAAVAYLIEQDACEAVTLSRREIQLLKDQRDEQAATSEARKLLEQGNATCASSNRPAPDTITGPSRDPHYFDDLKEDLARAQKTYAPGSPSVLGRRFNVASELAKLGRNGEACKVFADVARAFTDTWLATSAEMSRIAQLSQQRTLAVNTIDGIASTCVGGSINGLEALLFLKGHVLEGIRQEATLIRLSEGKEREAALRLRSARARIASSLLANDDPGLPNAIDAKEQLERELTAPGRGFWAIEPLGVIGGVVGLRRSLLPDEAYVDLTTYDSPYGGRTRRKAVAVVLTRDAASWVDLGPEAPIRQARTDWLGAIANWKATGREQLDHLKSLLVQPILAKLPTGINHLIVSADPRFDGVPWQHPDLTGNSTVWLVGSARELVRYKLAAASSEIAPRARMAVMHDVDFDAGSGALVTPLARLDALRDPALIRPNDGIHAPAGTTIEDLAGRLPTPDAFFDELSRAQILHVETHGVVLEPEESHDVQRTPFSTAAVALAGANRQDSQGRRLGIVSAEELVGAVSPDLRIATLAMCDGARGASIPGQGNLGLATALASAGTPFIVASSWRSSVESASILFPKFYDRLFAIGDGRAAFEEAVAAVRGSADLGGARHWAGWLYLGYGRESRSPTLEMSRLVNQLCNCPSAECGWRDAGPMNDLKRILATPNLSAEDQDVILGLVVGLKQCAPESLQAEVKKN